MTLATQLTQLDDATLAAIVQAPALFTDDARKAAVLRATLPKFAD